MTNVTIDPPGSANGGASSSAAAEARTNHSNIQQRAMIGNEPVIRLNGVSRWFGSVVAVSDVTFDISPGITGLLGPNGAGKTTLLRMMTGLAATSTGTVTVFGESVRDNPPLYRRIGVMSEHETVYGFMKGREFVRAMGKLRNVENLEAAVDRAIGYVDLADAQHRPMDTYSRGMRQRMRLAATLVARLAPVLHVEVEELAEEVLLIVNGKLAASGGFRAIRAALNQRPYHVRVICDAPRKLASAVLELDSVDAVQVDPEGAIVVLSRDVQALQIELPRLAQARSIRLKRVEPLDDSLESVFGYLVEK